MKILLITDNHYTSGGAEHYFFDLKARLKKIPGLSVYSMGFGPKAEEGEDYFVLKSLQSNFTKLIWWILFNPLVYLKLRKQIKKINPDVIHLHNFKQYTASVIKAIKPYPVVQTIHDYSVICPVSHNIHKNNQPCPTGFKISCFWQHQVKYNRLIYLALVYAFYKAKKSLQHSVKKFFAPSPLLVSYLKKNQFHDALYIPPFKQNNQPHAFDKIDPHHFLFAGNLGAHKGTQILLEEFALASQKNPLLTLTISGSGPNEALLKEKVKKLGLAKKISFTGWQDNLQDEYTTCAAVIFPSIWVEAFGLVMTEAMSHARPIIGSNRGSPAWLVDHQKTGLIFDPIKKGDLASKILCLSGNLELVKLLGQNGFDKLQTFISNEETLETIIKTYQSISKHHSSKLS